MSIKNVFGIVLGFSPNKLKFLFIFHINWLKLLNNNNKYYKNIIFKNHLEK
jgi:hypothetical protein